MPHFNQNGQEISLCQVCLRDVTESDWRPDITGHKGAGNTCLVCIAKHDNASKPKSGYEQTLAREQVRDNSRLISLAEHCHTESGGLTGSALQNYIKRHYSNE